MHPVASVRVRVGSSVFRAEMREDPLRCDVWSDVTWVGQWLWGNGKLGERRSGRRRLSAKAQEAVEAAVRSLDMGAYARRCRDPFGNEIKDGVRVRVMAYTPPRPCFGTVESLDVASGTMVVREARRDGHVIGCADVDVRVLPTREGDAVFGLYDPEPLEKAGWRQLENGLWWHPERGHDAHLGTVAAEIMLSDEVIDEVIAEEAAERKAH